MALSAKRLGPSRVSRGASVHLSQDDIRTTSFLPLVAGALGGRQLDKMSPEAKEVWSIICGDHDDRAHDPAVLGRRWGPRGCSGAGEGLDSVGPHAIAGLLGACSRPAVRALGVPVDSVDCAAGGRCRTRAGVVRLVERARPIARSWCRGWVSRRRASRARSRAEQPAGPRRRCRAGRARRRGWWRGRSRRGSSRG